MSFSPGDVEVHAFSLSGADVRPKVTRFSVFENLMKPYVSVTAELADNTDMINQLLSYNGVELVLSFSQPGQEPYEGTFSVTAVERSKSTGSLRTSLYTMSAYSRHMTQFPRVQKAYRELPATGIAEDLVKNFLVPDKSLTIRAPSKGVLGNDHMPFNVNGVQIHKAIRTVLERAVSSVDPSSAYVFFENNKNMVIDTLENMKNSMSPVATYIQRPMGQNFLNDQALQNFVILSLREDTRIDVSNNVEAENQQTNPFDIFNFANTGRVVGDKSLVSTIMNIAQNALRPPLNLNQVLPERKKIANDFDSQALTIHVPLNPAVTVGTAFAAELLAPAGDTNYPVRDKLSGNFLATEVRHSVDLGQRRMQGTTTARGVKGEAVQ